MIVFFRVSKLIKQLQEDAVPEREKLHYFVFLILFYTLCGTATSDAFDLLSAKIGSTLFYTRLYQLISILLISGVGSYFLWRVNQSGDGKNFFERYWCLQLPVLMWSLVVTLVSISVFIVIALQFGHDAVTSETSIPLVIWENVMIIFVFGLFYTWMKRVSHKI